MNKGTLISLIAGGAIGGGAGYAGLVFIGIGLPQGLSASEEVLWLWGLFAWLLVSFAIHIIVHEAGHLLAGLRSGYEFVSFRIFSIMFIKKNGKLSRKKFTVVGTAGQCLLSPPDCPDGKYPYILYNLGGALANFVLSGICFAVYAVFNPGWAGSAFLLCFAGAGLVLGLSNLIPLKMGGIANDGYNAITLGRQEAARRSFWLQLRIHALQTQGVRLRDMPAEWFEVPEDADLNDVMTASSAILAFSRLVDLHLFDDAKKWGEHILLTANKLLGVYKNELLCELLFLEIIGACRKEEIERLYNKELKAYIKATSSYVSRQRLLYAYEKLASGDAVSAQKVRAKFETVCTTYPNEGEVVSEQELVGLIDAI